MRIDYAGLALVSLLVASCGSGTDQTAADPLTEATAENGAGEGPVTADDSEDALVPGTEYHATTTLLCSVDGGITNNQCDAGVIRNWGDEPGGALVEVTKPDGMKRAIFFRGTEAYGADSAEADGSASWDFTVDREGDVSTITFGPERYVIVDALVEGG